MTAATFQPDLFTVYAASPEEWRDHAERLAARYAETGHPFTADDLRDIGLEEPDHPNRWGAMFNTLARRGLIHAVGFTTSRRAARHNSVLRVWQGTHRNEAHS